MPTVSCLATGFGCTGDDGSAPGDGSTGTEGESSGSPRPEGTSTSGPSDVSTGVDADDDGADASGTGDGPGTGAPGDGADSTGSAPSIDCEAIAGMGAEFYEDNVVIEDRGPGPDLIESTPEAEDLDAALLQSASDALSRQPALLSFIVLRHGAIVWEDYFHGAGPADANNIHSASKSMISTLVGIAIDRGDIEGLEVPVATLLPDVFAEIDDEAKLGLTLEHVLTMSAGLAWQEDSTEYDIDDTRDWVQAIVDLPMDAAPGEVFNYNTGLSHLASAVLTEATGMSTCTFAHTYLFDPLGIDVERWGRDPQGYFSGGYNVFMTPREMAAFGLLHLQAGQWNGKSIVSAGFVSAAASPHFPDYGYLWWRLAAAGHEVQTAWGYGGQLIYLIADLDLVVVMTTNTQGDDPDFDGRDVLADYVVPAAG